MFQVLRTTCVWLINVVFAGTSMRKPLFTNVLFQVFDMSRAAVSTRLSVCTCLLPGLSLRRSLRMYPFPRNPLLCLLPLHKPFAGPRAVSFHSSVASTQALSWPSQVWYGLKSRSRYQRRIGTCVGSYASPSSHTVRARTFSLMPLLKARHLTGFITGSSIVRDVSV